MQKTVNKVIILEPHYVCNVPISVLAEAVPCLSSWLPPQAQSLSCHSPVQCLTSGSCLTLEGWRGSDKYINVSFIWTRIYKILKLRTYIQLTFASVRLQTLGATRSPVRDINDKYTCTYKRWAYRLVWVHTNFCKHSSNYTSYTRRLTAAGIGVLGGSGGGWLWAVELWAVELWAVELWAVELWNKRVQIDWMYSGVIWRGTCTHGWVE